VRSLRAGSSQTMLPAEQYIDAPAAHPALVPGRSAWPERCGDRGGQADGSQRAGSGEADVGPEDGSTSVPADSASVRDASCSARSTVIAASKSSSESNAW
jgi:hypothetical protein